MTEPPRGKGPCGCEPAEHRPLKPCSPRVVPRPAAAAPGNLLETQILSPTPGSGAGPGGLFPMTPTGEENHCSARTPPVISPHQAGIATRSLHVRTARGGLGRKEMHSAQFQTAVGCAGERSGARGPESWQQQVLPRPLSGTLSGMRRISTERRCPRGRVPPGWAVLVLRVGAGEAGGR